MAVGERGWTVETALGELGTGGRWEIDRGRLIVREPVSYRHGDLMLTLGSALRRFVAANDLGVVVVGDVGFRLQRAPDTLRAPDVAFVSWERHRRIADPHAFADVAPDLVVELLSPSERPGYVDTKVMQFLALGVRSVWVVDPRRRSLRRHLAGGGERVFVHPDETVEDPTLPGFGPRLGELVPEPPGCPPPRR